MKNKKWYRFLFAVYRFPKRWKVCYSENSCIVPIVFWIMSRIINNKCFTWNSLILCKEIKIILFKYFIKQNLGSCRESVPFLFCHWLTHLKRSTFYFLKGYNFISMIMDNLYSIRFLYSIRIKNSIDYFCNNNQRKKYINFTNKRMSYRMI